MELKKTTTINNNKKNGLSCDAHTNWVVSVVVSVVVALHSGIRNM